MDVDVDDVDVEVLRIQLSDAMGAGFRVWGLAILSLSQKVAEGLGFRAAVDLGHKPYLTQTSLGLFVRKVWDARIVSRPF